MKLLIKQHVYAPEQNELYVVKKGKVIHLELPLNKRRKLTSIKEARKLFKAYERPFVYATIKTTFPDSDKDLNHEVRGAFKGRKEVLDYVRDKKEINQYGQYIDHSGNPYLESYTMPMPKIEIKTQIVG